MSDEPLIYVYDLVLVSDRSFDGSVGRNLSFL
jgi:hypothetical protein